MAKQKLVALFFSAVLLAGVTYAALLGLARFETRWVESTRALLTGAAASAQTSLRGPSPDLPQVAMVVAGDLPLAAALKQLEQSYSLTRPGAEPSERIRAIVERLTLAVNERLTILRAVPTPSGQAVDGLALLDDAGNVVVSSSEFLKVGSTVGAAPVEAAAPTDETAAAEVAAPLPVRGVPAQGLTDPAALGTAVLAGGSGSVTYLRDGAIITTVAGAPIFHKDKLVGAVLVERSLRAMDAPTGVDAVVLAGEKPILGRAPPVFKRPKGSTPRGPYLVAAVQPKAMVPFYGEVDFAPLFTTGTNAGLWAHKFDVPGLEQLTGFVVTELSTPYAELAGLQLAVLVLAALLFLALVLIIAPIGRGHVSGLNRLADQLGRMQQGLVDENRLVERQFPASLHRLVRLINNRLEKAGPAAPAAAASAASTSIDQVIQVQSVPAKAPDVHELEFAGITNVGIDSAVAAASRPDSPFAAVKTSPVLAVPAAYASSASSGDGEVANYATTAAAPAADEDGYEQMGELADALGLAADGGPVATPEVLPDMPEAIDAVMSSFDAVAAPTISVAQQRNAPAPDQPMGGLVGFGQDVREGATVVHQISPDLLASMKGSAVGSSAKLAAVAQAVGPLEDSFVFGGDELASPEAGDDATHYREVFSDFISTRKKCGEPVDDLTYEKFALKLEKSKEAVVQKHSCRTVRFQVYVKNGKAALKATPAA